MVNGKWIENTFFFQTSKLKSNEGMKLGGLICVLSGYEGCTMNRVKPQNPPSSVQGRKNHGTWVPMAVMIKQSVEC